MIKYYFGVTGELVSGKSTIAKFFEENLNAEYLKFSKLLDEILAILDLPFTRKNEQDMGVLLKELYGEEILTWSLIHKAKESKKSVVLLDGIRKKEELEAIRRELPDFKFIFIKTKPEIRYQRMLERFEKVGENSQSYEEFLESQRHEADKQLASLEQYADFVIENNGSLDEFKDKIKQVLQKVGVSA